MKTIESLKNKLLIAMPDLVDPYFGQSVVYIYDHGPEGATGFIINKPMSITVGDILDHIPKQSVPELVSKITLPMLLGGPLKQEQLFMIFSEETTKQSEKALKMVDTKDMITSISEGVHNDNVMAFLGYASWVGGQLEKEIVDNSWLIMPANYEMLYKIPYNRRYETAANLMGFSLDQLSVEVGHA